MTVLTGFLGSGKTTLLRRALSAPGLSDTAVLVNEIGEIAIDHHLLDYVDGDIVELPGGCLCCTVREDLARGLRGLLDRRDAGELKPFRRFVVETSGLADPAPILYTLGADPVLDLRLRLARVVTLVDAVSGVDTLGRYPEATAQAALADTLVLTKTDLAPPSRVLDDRLNAINATARRMVVAPADDAGAVLFADGEAPSVIRARTGTPTAAAHTHGIDTFALRLDGPIGRLDFAKALGGLAGAFGADLLRVKGLVAFADRPDRPAVVQAAQHALYEPEWLESWPDDDRRSRLVFVVREIPRSEILARFAFASPSPIS